MRQRPWLWTADHGHRPTCSTGTGRRERNKQANPCILKNSWLLVYLLFLMTLPFAAGRKG